MKQPFLIGSGIYLRALGRADAARIAAWLNDPEVTRTLRFYRPQTEQSEIEYIEAAYRSDRDLLLGIALRADDRLIGVTGLHQIDLRNRRASFAIAIGERDTWGRGHGTEATRLILRHGFETLNLHRIWLHVFESNPRAIRAYVSVGFRREGVLREDHYRDGRYWDTISMGLLRSEWVASAEVPRARGAKRAVTPPRATTGRRPAPRRPVPARQSRLTRPVTSD